MKKKFKLLFILIFLAIIIFIINPNKSLAQYVEGLEVGEERYTINFTHNNNIPNNFIEYYEEEYPDDFETHSFFYLNYKDKNGNDLDISGEDTPIIEYSCFNSETCYIEYYDDINQIHNEKIYYIEFKDKADVPYVVNYKNVDYTLNYYYVFYGSDFYYNLGIPTYKVNGQQVERLYDFYYNGVWISNKIYVNQNLTDNIVVDYDLYIHNLKVSNIIKGDNIDSNRTNDIEIFQGGFSIPDGKYNDINIVENVINLSLKNNESVIIPIIGNQFLYFRSEDANEFLVETNVNDKLECYAADNQQCKNLGNGEITFTHTFTPAKPLIIKNNVVNGDSYKEFGFTLSLDGDIDGVYSGIKFNDGVGRFYLRAGEEKEILLPNNEVDYLVNATGYLDYNLNKGSFSGTISSDESITHEFTYTFNNTTALDGVYSGTVVSLEEMVPGKSYIAFRATGGVGYLLTGKGNAKVMTSYQANTGGKVTWPDNGDAYSNVLWTFNGTKDKALFESFGAVNSYLTVGKSTSGNRPVGNEVSYVKLETSSSPAMKVSNGGYFLQLMSDNKKYTSATSGSSLYFAEIDEPILNVEFSGSNDGLHIYTGAEEKNYSVISGSQITAPTIDNVKSPIRYNYELKSWIELETGLEIEPGETLIVDREYKFYANWVPKTYDIGVNKNVVGNLDTSSFIKTEVFDYSELYNLYSTDYQNNRWSFISEGSNVYFASDEENYKSTGTLFVDNYANSKNGLLTSVDNRNKNNASKEVKNGNNFFNGIVTQGLSDILIDNLFDKNSNRYGVNYIGEDNFLYQFDPQTGLYYYDSSKNAASYNKTDKRFYVYDYVIGTNKSFKDGENKADFLPFNYLSKEDVSKNKNVNASNGSVNYWFGLKSEIVFNLIDNPGVLNEKGEYGNKDLLGNDMIFKYSGDDDVFVYVDDKLVLDLGGLHDSVYGEINFSTGVVTVAQNGASIDASKAGGIGYSESDIQDETKIKQYNLTDILSGEHKLTFYYIDRGASRSKLAMYFNISDVYDKPGNIVIKRDMNILNSKNEHKFTMTLSDNTINGQYGDVNFEEGISKFSLKGGESVTVSDLPAGVNYKVVAEIPLEHNGIFSFNGKTYTANIMEGRIVGGNTILVDYINNFDETSVPKTYDGIYKTIVSMLLSYFSLLLVGAVYHYGIKKIIYW